MTSPEGAPRATHSTLTPSTGTHAVPSDARELGSLDARIRFLADLGRRLHVAGVSASRLEGAVASVSRAIGVSCEILSTPTSLLLSLGDATAPNVAPQTRVLRLEPGNTDLKALVILDKIAEQVIDGEVDIEAAALAMATLDRPRTTRRQVANVAAFGLAAAGLAGLLRTGWIDIGVALVLGLLIGWLQMLSSTRPHFAAASARQASGEMSAYQGRSTEDDEAALIRAHRNLPNLRTFLRTFVPTFEPVELFERFEPSVPLTT